MHQLQSELVMRSIIFCSFKMNALILAVTIMIAFNDSLSSAKVKSSTENIGLTGRIWPSGIVKYSLEGLDGTSMDLTKKAIRYISENTCIKMRKFTKKYYHNYFHPHYLLVIVAGCGYKMNRKYLFNRLGYKGYMTQFQKGEFILEYDTPTDSYNDGRRIYKNFQFCDVGGENNKNCIKVGRNNKTDPLKQIVKALGLIVNQVKVSNMSVELSDDDLRHLKYLYCCDSIHLSHNPACFANVAFYKFGKQKHISAEMWSDILKSNSFAFLSNLDFKYYDIDNDGSVSRAEYTKLYIVQMLKKDIMDIYSDLCGIRSTGNTKATCYDPKTKSFDLHKIDLDNDTRVNLDEFTSFVKIGRKNLSDKWIKGFFHFLDANNDEHLSYCEEVKLFCVMDSARQNVKGLNKKEWKYITERIKSRKYQLTLKQTLLFYIIKKKW